MKLTMYYKDSVRKLKKSIFRYISIVIIIMLGVGFFVGMNSIAPDMKNTTEQYFKDTSAFDIQLLSNLGYEKDDLQRFKDIEDVSTVEGAYDYDVLIKSDKKNRTIRIISSSTNSKINKNSLIEGREPIENNECLIDTRLTTMYGYKVGDTIEIFKKGEDISKKFSETKFTVVGVTRNPLFLSGFYGSTELENGELEGFIAVKEDIIKLDKFTAVYIKTNIDSNIERTSNEYKDKLDKIAEKVEEENDKLVKEKYNREYSKNSEKIAENEEKIKKTIKVVKDAKNEIILSQQKINDSIVQICITTGKTTNLNEQKIKLDEVYSAIKTLYDEKEEVEVEYEKLKSEKEAKEQELFDLDTSVNNKIYESHLVENENAKYVELTREINRMDSKYNTKKTEYENFKKEYDEVEKKLKEQKEKINAKQDEIETKQNQFYKEFTKLFEKDPTMSNPVISGIINEIKDGQKELDKNIKELEDANIDERIEKAKDKIADAKKELSKFEPISKTTQLPETSAFKSLDNDLEKMAIMGKVFPVMFFVVAALVTITTITRMIEEDRTNIGTLKSLGYKKSTIMSKYLIYSLSATVLGLILGTIIGSTLIVLILFDAYTSLYVLPDLVIEINVLYTLLASIISILATVGVTVVITRKELKEKPAMLMRPKQAKEGKNIFLEKIPSFWERLSFLLKICIRNIFRYKRRLFMTLIGIAGCTMLIYTGICLKYTVDNISVKQFSEIRFYDMEVNVSNITNEKDINEVKDFIIKQEKIKECAPTRQLMTTVKKDDKSKEVFYTVIDKDEVGKYIKLKERSTQKDIDLNDNGIVITEKLSKYLDVNVGDKINIIDDDEEKMVEVIGISESYLYNYIYMTPELYTQVFGKEVQYNVFVANIEEIEEDEEVILSNDLKENDKISGTVYIRNVDKEFQNSLSGLTSIVFLFIGCASLLSFVVLINLNNINIEERRRELATFKLLGFFKKELEHYIFRENIILTVLGAILGVILGLSVLGLVIQSAEVETIMIPVEFDIKCCIISFAITLAFTLITNVMMKKKIKKIDMIESLKSVE